MRSRLALATVWAGLVCLIGCGSVGYQTPSGAPGSSYNHNNSYSSYDNNRRTSRSTSASANRQSSDSVGGSVENVGPHSILLGDMNLNGMADVADCLLLRQISDGAREVPPNRYPDVNEDGTVDETDCDAVQRAATGLAQWPIRSIGPAILVDIAPDDEGIQDGYSPSVVEVPRGGEFTVDVWAVEVTDFEGIALDFDLGENPAVRIDAVRQGPFMESRGAQVEFEPTVDGTEASVICRIRRATEDEAPDGEGIIAYLDCTALEPGAETTMTVSPSEADPDTAPVDQSLVMHGALVRVASR